MRSKQVQNVQGEEHEKSVNQGKQRQLVIDNLLLKWVSESPTPETAIKSEQEDDQAQKIR